MIEAMIVGIMLLTMIFFYFGWPVLRHYWDQKAKHEALVKRYNRLWRSRRDLLVSQVTHSFICANSSCA